MGFVEFHNADDAYIWDKFRDGNTNAFEIIYERNISLLANYGNRLCKDREIIKDAIQDMYVDIWRNRANLGRTDSIKLYLLKAFRRNLVKKITAQKKAEGINIPPDAQTEFFETAHDFVVIESEMEAEKLNRLNELINLLPSRQKEAIFLRFYSGLGFADISDIMGINQQSAYNMVFRALELMRSKAHSGCVGFFVLMSHLFFFMD